MKNYPWKQSQTWRMKMSEVKNYFIQGAVLIDVDGAALNNQGLKELPGGKNSGMTKSIKKGRDTYAMISGQAWRYWWRESCAYLGWKLSPILKDGEKLYYTEAMPDKYEDDDIFGYMRAEKNTKTKATYTRISPLKNSILVSVVPTKILDEFAIMGRQHGDGDNPAPYGKESYSAIMKGLFSLDLSQAGTFTSTNRSGYMNISKDKFEELAKEKGHQTIKDPIYEAIEKLRLPLETRTKRVSETIKALKTISGGAKRTTNYASVKPDFIILAIIKGGNNPFDNLFVNKEGRAAISGEALIEVIRDNKEYIISSIYIGKAKGFMDEHNLMYDVESSTNDKSDKTKDESEPEQNKETKKCIEVGAITLYFGSVNEMIDKFVSENIEKILKEME